MMTVSHASGTVVAVNKVLHLFGLFRRSQKASARHSRQQSREFTFMTKRLACTAYEVIKDLTPSVLLAIVLYAPVSESVARYCMACSVISMW